MRNTFLSLLFALCFCSTFSQELLCNVVVNSDQSGNTNAPVIKTLEKQLNEFVNNTKWTNQTYKLNEKIECSMFINVTNFQSDIFKATIQVQSSRPVYNSSYQSPVYNFLDEDFTFNYLEYQNLIFNESQFESNLVSVIAFHVYMILGFDADTFGYKGGDKYYEQALEITNYSQGSGYLGWSSADGRRNRFELIDSILSSKFDLFRRVLYNYHLRGLDIMEKNGLTGKNMISNQISVSLMKQNNSRPSSYLMRVFFDAKGDEIVDIFTDGPEINLSRTLNALNTLAPTLSSKWNSIKD